MVHKPESIQSILNENHRIQIINPKLSREMDDESDDDYNGEREGFNPNYAWSVHSHRRCTVFLQACVARLMLCVRRLEERGETIVMDPAVLEEMLQQQEVEGQVCMWMFCCY